MFVSRGMALRALVHVLHISAMTFVSHANASHPSYNIIDEAVSYPLLIEFSSVTQGIHDLPIPLAYFDLTTQHGSSHISNNGSSRRQSRHLVDTEQNATLSKCSNYVVRSKLGSEGEHCIIQSCTSAKQENVDVSRSRKMNNLLPLRPQRHGRCDSLRIFGLVLASQVGDLFRSSYLATPTP